MTQLNVEEQGSLEKDLTLEELNDALAFFADKKSPGEDGLIHRRILPKAFFDLSGKDLLNLYNDFFHKGFIAVTQKRGAITLIPNGDANPTDVKN